MRIKRTLSLLSVGDDHIVVSPDSLHVDMTNVHTLNETAARIWDIASASEEIDAGEVAHRITEEYDVEYDEAFRDVTALLKQWEKEGLTEN